MRKTVLFSALVLSFILSAFIITPESKGDDEEYNNIPNAKEEFIDCLSDCCKASDGEWMSADEARQALRQEKDKAAKTGKPFKPYGFSMEDFESSKGCYLDCGLKGQFYEECKSACKTEWGKKNEFSNY